MNALVTRYIISRGLRVAAVVLFGVLGVVVVHALPGTPLWMLLRLGLLVAGLLWSFRMRQCSTLACFLRPLLAFLLWHQPLGACVRQLAEQASASTVFLIGLFGGTRAVVSRQDLLDALPPTT